MEKNLAQQLPKQLCKEHFYILGLNRCKNVYYGNNYLKIKHPFGKKTPLFREDFQVKFYKTRLAI